MPLRTATNDFQTMEKQGDSYEIIIHMNASKDFIKLYRNLICTSVDTALPVRMIIWKLQVG